MAKLSGIVTITLNGQTINSQPGAGLDPGGRSNTTVTTDQRSDYSQSLRPAKVTCAIPHSADVDLGALNDFVGTVQFITDTGVAYVLANAWRVGELMVTVGSNGNIPLEFNADRAVKFS